MVHKETLINKNKQNLIESVKKFIFFQLSLKHISFIQDDNVNDCDETFIPLYIEENIFSRSPANADLYLEKLANEIARAFTRHISNLLLGHYHRVIIKSLSSEFRENELFVTGIKYKIDLKKDFHVI